MADWGFISASKGLNPEASILCSQVATARHEQNRCVMGIDQTVGDFEASLYFISVNVAKYLGLHFYNKMTWKVHIAQKKEGDGYEN